MISLTDGGIRWEKEDVRLMSKIFGSEHAVIKKKHASKQIPLLMSVLKLAEQKGGLLSRRALSALRTAQREHSRIEKMKAWDDADIPDKRAYSYFKHQRADLGFLYASVPTGTLVASEAGVGKTLIGIRYPEFLRSKRIMLICPNTAKEQWADEIRRWSSQRLPITIVDGTIKTQIQQIRRAHRGWVIGHPESLVHARDGWLDASWDMAILDEAHVFNNRRTLRANTAHAIDATYRMAMTAHPYANSTAELFSILKFLYPDVYTSFWRWVGLHVIIDEGPWGGLDLSEPRRPGLLRWEIAPFTIRRLWKDVWKNLPPITRVQCTVYLTARGAAEYRRLKKQFFAELSSLDDQRNIWAIPSDLARVTRLRQYLIDPAILGSTVPSIKYTAILEKMEELSPRVPVIFTMFRKAAIRLQAYLQEHKKRVAIIVGGSRKKIRPIQKNFLNGKYDAVIIMISVGGTALNFGKYGVIFSLDQPWNQRDLEQIEGRVRRPEEGSGKVVPCTHYRFIVKDSYEEKTMLRRQREKHEDFSKVFTVAQARELFEDDI